MSVLGILIGLFGVTGALAFISGFSEWRDEIVFKRDCLETAGRVVGSIKAQYKMETGEDEDMDGEIDVVVTDAGYLIFVEYEAGGYIYKIKSQQAYYPIPQEVTVQYNIDKPSDAIIDNFHSGGNKYYQMVGGFAFVMIPVLYWLSL